MSEFISVFNQFLHDKSVEESDKITIRDGHNLLTYGCWQLLADIGASESRNYSQDTAHTMKRTLLEEYPKLKWVSLLALRKAILNGSIDLKGGSVGSIMRCLNQRVETNGYHKSETERVKYPEELQHRTDYLERFPNKEPVVDEQCSMDQFLAMHPAGTFPSLELLRDRKLNLEFPTP